jgi:hypothetical protein
MSILYSVLGWFFTFLAMFIAIGHPAPGPEQARQEEMKTLWMLASLFLSALFLIAGVARAARKWNEAKLQGGVSILLFSVWSLGLLWMALSA